MYLGYSSCEDEQIVVSYGYGYKISHPSIIGKIRRSFAPRRVHSRARARLLRELNRRVAAVLGHVLGSAVLGPVLHFQYTLRGRLRLYRSPSLRCERVPCGLTPV